MKSRRILPGKIQPNTFCIRRSLWRRLADSEKARCGNTYYICPAFHRNELYYRVKFID